MELYCYTDATGNGMEPWVLVAYKVFNAQCAIPSDDGLGLPGTLDGQFRTAISDASRCYSRAQRSFIRLRTTLQFSVQKHVFRESDSSKPSIGIESVRKFNFEPSTTTAAA